MIDTLSGRNVQRANWRRRCVCRWHKIPCFGLDVSAIREIDSRLPEERNRGAVVLILSEDVDKLLELANRVMVMFEGRLVFETDRSQAKALRVTVCC